MDYLKAGLLVGAVGDIGLQLLAYNGNTSLFNDLKPYFEYQTPIISVIKASLLTGFWSAAYGFIDTSPSLLNFSVFCAFVDMLYRQFYPTLYPSLSTYYRSYDSLHTIAANIGVAGLVYYTIPWTNTL